MDLTKGQIFASVATPSLFFLLLIGVVVFILIAKNIKIKRNEESDDMDDQDSYETETESSVRSAREERNEANSNDAFWNEQQEIQDSTQPL